MNFSVDVFLSTRKKTLERPWILVSSSLMTFSTRRCVEFFGGVDLRCDKKQ